ncbi:MAG: type IV secretion system protein, partial [Thiohalocapsa sp.]
VQSLTEQLNKMQEQLDTLKQQSETITNMYNEGRGVTAHATMLDNSVDDLHGFFPSVEYEIAELFSGPLGKVASGLRNAKEMFNIASLTKTGAEHLPSMDIYAQRGDVVYAYMTVATDSYNELSDRRPMLQSFVQAASTANTEKAILDLNTRINAETLLMLNDIAMLSAFNLMAAMDLARVDHNESGLALYRPPPAPEGVSTDEGATDGADD